MQTQSPAGGDRRRAWILGGVLLAAVLAVVLWRTLGARRELEGVSARPQQPALAAPQDPATALPEPAGRVEPGQPAEVEREPTAVDPPVEPKLETAWWPELVLAVRDEHSRAELEQVELCCIPNSYMRASWRRPGSTSPYTALGRDLHSPIALRGGRPAARGSDYVYGIGLRTAADGELDYIEMEGGVTPDRGVVIWARTPTHAWGRIELDVAAGGERELLLGPAAGLRVQFTNLAFEGYAALEEPVALRLMRRDLPTNGRQVWIEGLDEEEALAGLRFAALEPGAYSISVELGDSNSWRPRVVLASEDFSLAAGEQRELLLALDDPPAPRARATLAGTLSFPDFPGEAQVSLRFYDCTTYSQGSPDASLSLDDMQRVGGAQPSWSFEVEGLREGRYQAKLWPFLKSWMIDLPPEGLPNLELTLSELAEVVVETVDARSGERVPLTSLRYSDEEFLPDQVNHLSEDASLNDGEPGRFRFWTAPGKGGISTSELPSELHYGDRWERMDFEAGFQSIRFELELVCAIRIEFRDGDAVLPRGDAVYDNLEHGIRALEHDGRVTHIKLATKKLVEVTEPGPYEINFEGVGADRYLPIPLERVDVRPGETAEVIVELRRK